MALQGTDFFIISRVGSHYKITGNDLLSFMQSNLGTNEKEVADIAARNALTGLSLGDRVRVINATGDATVNTGWAIYSYLNPGWLKIIEQEGIDFASVTTNLTATPGANGVTITNNNGTGFSIGLADGTNAGLFAASEKTKLANITVTAATNLDNIRNASHAAVTTAGNATTNPITVAGQALSFNIGGLADAP